MSNTVNVNLCLLWEDEIRTAARLLRHAQELPEGTPGDQVTAAISAAYSACLTALWGLKDDHAAVLMASGEIKRFAAGKKGDV